MSGVSDEMVERAAEAMSRDQRQRHGQRDCVWADDIEMWRMECRARARAALAAVMPDVVAAEREACAVIATQIPRGAANLCPYLNDNPGDPTWGHTEDDICPVCRKNGHENASHCTSSVAGSIAAAIRARGDA